MRKLSFFSSVLSVSALLFALGSCTEGNIDNGDNTIGGYYDYMDFMQWSHRYVVSELTAGRMVWTAEDDPAEVRVYSRMSAMPDMDGVSQ